VLKQHLSDLLPEQTLKTNPLVGGVCCDSRLVLKNDIFVAIDGVKEDGIRYIADAIEKGASAIIAKKMPIDIDVPDDIAVIIDPNPRLLLSRLVARFYPRQPQNIVAVTGTNGKTSVAEFTRQIWDIIDIKAASLGTLGLVGGDALKNGTSMTTLDPVSLHSLLNDLAATQKIDHLAMEASSHGLSQYRLHNVNVSAAGFTSFSQDHLDYHETMDDYFAAKALLFTEVLSENGVAVINADMAQADALRQAVKARGLKLIEYGFAGADLKIKNHEITPQGQSFILQAFGKEYAIDLPLAGAFQAMNALCALGLVIANKQDNQTFVETAIEALAQLKSVAGRLQHVGDINGASVYVDYAHTPDALEQILKTLRPHTAGKLACLVGCGGNRDATKRPLMARIASDLADIVYITDDNPRSEKAEDIRAQMLAGIPEILHDKAFDCDGRGAAIALSIQNLQTGDVLVLAGKGHEQGQIIGDQTFPFDDVREARKIIDSLQNQSGVQCALSS